MLHELIGPIAGETNNAYFFQPSLPVEVLVAHRQQTALVIAAALFSGCGTFGLNNKADSGPAAVGDGSSSSDTDDDSSAAPDADGDGVPDESDCNDADPSMPNDDADCDGILTAQDCDDNDPLSTALVDDNDCDGTVTADDCDDNDPLLGPRANDADCDGTTTELDCDDSDPASYTLAQDADCDGITTADGDCDDTSADVNPEQLDMYPDGVDQNCDGLDGPDCSSVSTYPTYPDAWGDGWCNLGGNANENGCPTTMCADGYNGVRGAAKVNSFSNGLTELDDFYCLCSVGGRPGSDGLSIVNSSISDLTPLTNLQSIAGNVSIICNPNLDDSDINAFLDAVGRENIGGTVHTGYNGRAYNSGACY